MPINWEQLQNVCRIPREYLEAQLTRAAGMNQRIPCSAESLPITPQYVQDAHLSVIKRVAGLDFKIQQLFEACLISFEMISVEMILPQNKPWALTVFIGIGMLFSWTHCWSGGGFSVCVSSVISYLHICFPFCFKSKSPLSHKIRCTLEQLRLKQKSFLLSTVTLF